MEQNMKQKMKQNLNYNTSDFRTKTDFISRDNGHIEGIWELAIDLGYSAVKLFSPNSVAIFPNYAKRINADFSFASETPKNAIRYKDLTTGEMWLVGEIAQNIMTRGDTSDSETSLYGRERYANPMFKVIAETGLGLGMLENEFGKPGTDKIVIQTGLPERYLDDEDELRDFLSGEHRFAIQIADGPWHKFHFTISGNDVYVMSQPKGTLFSICIDSKGRFIPDAKNYLSSGIIIFDAGFGTLDIFPITAGAVGTGETYTDLGMKRILQETQKVSLEHIREIHSYTDGEFMDLDLNTRRNLEITETAVSYAFG